MLAFRKVVAVGAVVLTGGTAGLYSRLESNEANANRTQAGVVSSAASSAAQTQNSQDVIDAINSHRQITLPSPASVQKKVIDAAKPYTHEANVEQAHSIIADEVAGGAAAALGGSAILGRLKKLRKGKDDPEQDSNDDKPETPNPEVPNDEVLVAEADDVSEQPDPASKKPGRIRRRIHARSR